MVALQLLVEEICIEKIAVAPKQGEGLRITRVSIGQQDNKHHLRLYCARDWL